MAIDERYRKEIASRVYQYYLLPEAWTTFPDVLPTLEQLCERGLRLGLISNWDTSLSSVIAGMNLGHLFTDIIASADVMLHKPQPEIFQLALKRMNAQPTQAMHIGDHASADVAGASAAGITAIYLNREGKKLDGNLSISSLAELPQLV
jgi:putative hydrolase of the HAD superfamily